MFDRSLRLERAIDRYAGTLLVCLLSLFYRSGRRPSLPDAESVRRLLLVKLHGIGNIVMLLPALRALKNHFPRAKIDFLTFESNAGILEGDKDINSVLPLHRDHFPALLHSTIQLLFRLRKSSYDLVIDFDQFANFSAILSALTGAPCRVGFTHPAHYRGLLYTIPVSYVETGHMSRTFMKLAAAAGAQAAASRPPVLSLENRHREDARAFEKKAGIASGDTVVLMHPGSSENLTIRRWPLDRFAALADDLIERFGVKIVITGGRSELPLAEGMARSMTHHSVNAAGSLSVKGTATLCERAACVVSSDTAMVHIASAVGTPVVGLYGPNTPFLYGPLGKDNLVFYRDLPCSPCLVNINAKLSRCRRARCMEMISVEEVAEGIGKKYFDFSGYKV